MDYEEEEGIFLKVKALTIRQCMDRGIRRVYTPDWLENNCYIKLPQKIGDQYPPWLELYSEETQKHMGIETPQRLLALYLPAGLDTICIEYKGIISQYDQ